VPEQFFAPFVVFDYPGVALIDAAIHFNFAADGARELTAALAAPSFEKFARNLPRAPRRVPGRRTRSPAAVRRRARHKAERGHGRDSRRAALA